MCGIGGFVALSKVSASSAFMQWFQRLIERNLKRGPDTLGLFYSSAFDPEPENLHQLTADFSSATSSPGILEAWIEKLSDSDCGFAMFCGRGIPTTEIPQTFHQRQRTIGEIPPFATTDRTTVIAHNGIVSNDREVQQTFGDSQWSLMFNSSAEDAFRQAGYTHDIDTYAFLWLDAWCRKNAAPYGETVAEIIRGSYAISALRTQGSHRELSLARNYLGLHLAVVDIAGFLALVWSSEPIALEGSSVNCITPIEFPLYSHATLELNALRRTFNLSAFDASTVAHAIQIRRFLPNTTGCAVVLSGGLDSTTCAYHQAESGYNPIHLIYFDYGCRATAREKQAVCQIAQDLRLRYPHIEFVEKVIGAAWLSELGASSLTDFSRPVATGDKGAETNSEWVPARNLVFTSMVAAYCDANNIGTITLGLNLEAAGAFIDNSVEFVRALEQVVALATDKGIQIECPVKYMMKHHIVKYATELRVPLELTWSCYHEGPLRCGQCGPCRNTHRGFVMNGLPVIWEYQSRD